ncbi:MAG: AMP-binding protein [Armatimonadetes bacterium]|nr:AMP-binding protein [Armatimonadota bacterium]
MNVAQDRFNVAELLPRAAAARPEAAALLYRRGARYEKLTFSGLDRLSDGYAHQLRRSGIEPGQRVLLMVRNGPTFVALTFALFKTGALPVLIDPGMGLKPLLRCVGQLRPDALVGVRKAMALRTLAPRFFKTLRTAVCVDGFWPGAELLIDPPRGVDPFEPVSTGADDPAAILFTSGSTGPAKGVVYRHGIFRAQVRALQEMFEFEPGELDMPGFPLFALFSTALGMTCLLPDLDPSRPAKAEPARLVQAIRDFQVRNLQGSPAIWSRMGQYCRERGISLPSVRRVLTFGAPVDPETIRLLKSLLPNGEVYTPYGATEALPVSCISGREVLEDTALRSRQGAGTCVGRAAPGIEIAIVRTSERPLPSWEDAALVAQGEVGEICVSGEVVTWEYDGLPEATRAAKIRQDEKIWHRMGDLGYLDREGRLWLCGRKSHRVEGRGSTWFPVCAEGMVNAVPGVRRSALVGVGPPAAQTPVLIIEPDSPAALHDPSLQRKLADEARRALREQPLYGELERVLFHPSFPVDPRHNAKIHREELAVWAEGRLK